jgi:membrane-associated phospholipid phosphatase
MSTTCGESTGFVAAGQQQLSVPAALGGRRLLALAAILLTASALALAVDCQVSHFCLADREASKLHQNRIPGGIAQLVRFSEPFGHGFGVVAIALLIYQLDPPRRWAVPRLLTMALGAGLAADIGKLLIVRTRPREFDFASGNVWATFVRWLPLRAGPSGDQSFPSAHTATAFALAVGLAWLYPRGRWLFATMAFLVACQRVEAGAHYVSDVLFGAALGLVVAAGCLAFKPLAARFDHWEQQRAKAITADQRR